MSSTRRAFVGTPLRQEKYCSSAAYETGLLGNLVAKRAKMLKCSKDRQMIYFLQHLSHIGDGLASVTKELMRRFSKKVCMTASKLERYLWEICLNPEIDLANKRRLGVIELQDLWRHLEEYRQRHIASARRAIVSTSISRKITDDMEFALKSRSFVIIEGQERLGKSVTAQNFCALHAGEAIYVRLESGTDEASFFRVVARAIGTTFAAQRKTAEVRMRIEDMLQEGHLMLVLDEAHFLWPQTARARRAPSRMDWLRTTLVDYAVPVVLISTPQFDQQCQFYEKHVGWNSRQLKGRIALHTVLPTTLPEEDLMMIARHMLPVADKTTLMRLVGFAQASDDYVAGIERIVKRASYFAGQRDQYVPNSDDVKAAVSEIIPQAKNHDAAGPYGSSS